MTQPMKARNAAVRTKRIAVSARRQITLPIDFYQQVGIRDDEVECFVQEGAIVIRPVREDSGAFDEQILQDLISQGLAGEELLAKFKEIRHQIRPAVEAMLEDAMRMVRAMDKDQLARSTYDAVFGED